MAGAESLFPHAFTTQTLPSRYSPVGEHSAAMAWRKMATLKDFMMSDQQMEPNRMAKRASRHTGSILWSLLVVSGIGISATSQVHLQCHHCTHQDSTGLGRRPGL
ncbi:hypothetical protein CLAFUW4_02552 [Fulvia fulva]|uniref:Uncharacterized protein n=1 Tax=Passalora fulva TaxID=5499 RepID=A0A9Q8P5L1_PASFU|nr:uncharacterized protein CLAFUR5_02541 [Fulvia fulva]KAK4631572.1 hypothetical protein CLAFUR4_02547 [Fulvia fulva]KAK4633581.1 hypothetical protein CLAFUR0_02551 [Fulvia fulva]UJO14113.1 hypothetical protein CLAFUR5_02541 [Fulvia fulva]WPV11897.1 hypothetical protein CLAFUW4_02552 [Fulvia fulva]WPV26134.1 hypothetical protein CLAFUW7_02552 [Fulvia fulva]